MVEKIMLIVLGILLSIGIIVAVWIISALISKRKNTMTSKVEGQNTISISNDTDYYSDDDIEFSTKDETKFDAYNS